MGFEFLEHRSDIIILGKNRTLGSALEDVGDGMFTQMGAEHAKEKGSFELRFSAPTREQLVVQLLSEIIAECETRPFTPKRMEVLSFDEKALSVSVRVYGEKKVPENIIKAVTYHELRVEKKGGNWEIQILFDI
jgi:SHS2 domain-containing protein